MGKCNITLRKCEQLFHGTDSMEALDLSGCMVDESCVDELLHCFGKLRSLKLAYCDMVSPHALRPRIEKLR